MLCVSEAGVKLPLDTFIDARRFVRSDGHPPELEVDDRPILIIDDAGQIREVATARHADWQTILAYRAPDCSTHYDVCDVCCGLLEIELSSGTERCTREDCSNFAHVYAGFGWDWVE